LRIWYTDGGEYKPTKKGISFHPSKVKEIVEGILKIAESGDWDNF